MSHRAAQVDGAAAPTTGRAAAVVASVEFASALADIARAEKGAGRAVPLEDVQMAVLHIAAGNSSLFVSLVAFNLSIHFNSPLPNCQPGCALRLSRAFLSHIAAVSVDCTPHRALSAKAAASLLVPCASALAAIHESGAEEKLWAHLAKAWDEATLRRASRVIEDAGKAGGAGSDDSDSEDREVTALVERARRAHNSHLTVHSESAGCDAPGISYS